MTADGAERTTPGAVRPARLIAYAWGEKYLDDLLSITLPAALAPGNLPHVASVVPCEVVLLTEEKFKSRVDQHPTAQRIRRLCPLHLVGLDDLVHAKDKYGMTLTYALHRGLSDLGSAVTESYLFFLNADFVVGENSFRAVLNSLMAGNRLIAAPSYCVNYGSVAPILRPRINAATGALAISHRELADLALRNLHNTVRGKTLNQRKFHLKQIDQFYWQADAHALLGHQMPIAIVGMRPEQQVAEPNSFWDHGLIREFCPSEEPRVLGDSDDFLMIELREKGVAQEQIATGQADPRDAGERMVGWVTPYQRSFAPYQLTLHSKALPPSIAGERATLLARMNAILFYCPAFLPSHREHPQWNYHLGPFMAARHKYLSERLGQLTETDQLPADCISIDRVWWQLHGAAKRHQRNKFELERIRDHHLGFLEEQTNALSRSIAIRQKEINRHFITELTAILNGEATVKGHAPESDSWGIFSDTRFVERPRKPGTSSGAETLEKYKSEFDLALTQWDADVQMLARIRDTTSIYYALELRLLNEGALHELAQLEKQYALSTRAHVTSALVPRVRFHKAQDGQSVRRVSAGFVARLAAPTLYRLYRGPLRRVREMLTAISVSGANSLLVVTGDASWADREGAHFPGTCAVVAMTELLSGNLASAIDPVIKFDLCLCELGREQLFSFDNLANAVKPCLKAEARILGLYWHTRRASLSTDDLMPLDSLAPRVFIDQLPLATTYLARGLESLIFRPDKRPLSNTWRRLNYVRRFVTRSIFQRAAGKMHLPFKKLRAAPQNMRFFKPGTAITVELIMTAHSHADSCDCQEVG